MKSLTKNVQDERTLKKMIETAFSIEKCDSYTELTEGFFNIAYLVKMENGNEYILKIAPPKDVPVMAHEENMMHAEISAMMIAKENTAIPIAEVVFIDESCTICSSPYFFMERLTGESFFSQKDHLSEETTKKIRFETGRLNKQINSITRDVEGKSPSRTFGGKFGYIGLPEMQGTHWYSVFCKMIKAALNDVEKMNIDLKISPREIEKLLHDSSTYFEEVVTPRLVHWDLWDGNVFVKDGEITGFIDWERSMWADPLLEVGFRTYENNTDFLAGYGKEKLSEAEFIRALWYDIYLMIIAAQECDFRQYETRDTYNWSTSILTEKFGELSGLL